MRNLNPSSESDNRVMKNRLAVIHIEPKVQQQMSQKKKDHVKTKKSRGGKPFFASIFRRNFEKSFLNTHKMTKFWLLLDIFLVVNNVR